MSGMKCLTLVLCYNEELALKSVLIDKNETGLTSNSELVKIAAINMLKSFYLNKDDLLVQDLLRELNITISKTS
jgi:hypothetical protein